MKKSAELLEEFYESHKEEYPDMTLEDFKEVCYGPWRFLKQEMESGELPTVRLKYFGVFQVYEGRARNMLVNIKTKFDNLTMDAKQYFKLKTMLEKFLNGK